MHFTCHAKYFTFVYELVIISSVKTLILKPGKKLSELGRVAGKLKSGPRFSLTFEISRVLKVKFDSLELLRKKSFLTKSIQARHFLSKLPTILVSRISYPRVKSLCMNKHPRSFLESLNQADLTIQESLRWEEPGIFRGPRIWTWLYGLPDSQPV